MEEKRINNITGVKKTGSNKPTDKPFCETIRATSPRIIIPTPILTESLLLNLKSLAINPQPIILAERAIAINNMEYNSNDREKYSIEVFKPMLAKNTGPNNI